MKGPFSVGDVIQSDQFVNGERSSTGSVSVGYRSFFDHTDESRTGKHYVVERVEMEGGGTAHGPHDIYPDGWHVSARELGVDGNYLPDSELISFYTSGSFRCRVDPSDIAVVGHMAQTFLPKEGE